MSTHAKLKEKPKRTKGVIAVEKIRRRMSTFTDKERKRLKRYCAILQKGEGLTKREIADMDQMGKNREEVLGQKPRRKKPKELSLEEQNSFFAIRKSP